MTLTTLASRAEQIATDYSPQILTGIGVAGVFTTALLTGKATIKAVRILDGLNEDEIRARAAFPLDRREKVKLVWKLYVPPVAAGALTVSAIILASQIGTRRAAAMAAAFGLSEKALKEYKEQVVEHLGEAKERKIRDDLSQKQVHQNPPQDSQIIVTNAGEVLCYEPYTGRYFQSSIEALKKGQNDLNYRLLHHQYASLTEFYSLVGLDRTDISDDMGWSADKMLELEFSGTLTPDNRPCMVVTYQVAPRPHYYKVH